MAITIALIICLVAMGGVFIASQVRDNLDTQRARSLASQNLEHLVTEALSEGHYLLAMGVRPGASAAAARAELAAAVSASRATQDVGSDRAPVARTRVLDHDATTFLRDSSEVLYLPPVTVAATASTAHATALSPVQVRVKERRAGKRITLPAGQDLDPTHGQLAELGLPPGVVSYRSTWGVVELSCEASEKVRRMSVSRRAVQRKLFAVIEYEFYGEPARAYAHIFPEPIGQVVTAGTGWSLL